MRSFQASAWRIGSSVLLGAVGIAGCSLTIDPNREQCSTDDDCSKRGEAFAGATCVDSLCVAKPPVDPTWGCLDEPRVPASTDPGPFAVTLHLQDIIGGPHVGVKAKLCKKLDVACDDPQSDEIASNSAGDVVLSVPRAFAGYVSLTADDIMQGIYFFSPTVDSDRTLQVQIVSPGIADALTKSLGSPQKPENGIILLNVADCEGKAAVGVNYSSDATNADAIVFYSVDGLPASTATATDSSGYGGLVNVAPGTIAVTGKSGDDMRNMGTVSLVVKAGAITYSKLVPIGK
jgi:hypothetical protein